MVLVDYSDSDESETEQKPSAKPTSSALKSTFQKVVDKSNPSKIRVSLPSISSKEINTNEPPKKRIKTGNGGFADFNTFLPPPKRSGQASTRSGHIARSDGIAAGVNFKTGAAPGFDRMLDAAGDDEQSRELEESSSSSRGPVAGSMTFSQPKTTEENIQLVGKPLMFKPLSVTRKPTKKKAHVTLSRSPAVEMSSLSAPIKQESQSKQRKISLFAVPIEPSESLVVPDLNQEYKPMLFGLGAETEGDRRIQDIQVDEDFPALHNTVSSLPSSNSNFKAQNLNDIASDLHLSAAERRQLFGRHKGGAGPSVANIINFNTDEEYRHNEEIRATGEQVVHNPVRSIAPGKHNLKQLVNAASSQKEALEESFAKGKSTRAEAGSRYGW